MPLPICYLNGEYLPLAEARVSPFQDLERQDSRGRMCGNERRSYSGCQKKDNDSKAKDSKRITAEEVSRLIEPLPESRSQREVPCSCLCKILHRYL